MEEEVDPQLEVEVVQKTMLHERCEADGHVTDNTGLEGDPVDFNRYNKVDGLCLGSHHEYSKNHREDQDQVAVDEWHSNRAKMLSKVRMAKLMRICSRMLSNSVPSLIRVRIIKI